MEGARFVCVCARLFRNADAHTRTHTNSFTGSTTAECAHKRADDDQRDETRVIKA